MCIKSLHAEKLYVRTTARSAIFLFLTLLSCVSCVSVNLGAGKTTRAKAVQFIDPNGPFERLKDPNADAAWQSRRTGNTLSFFSECPQVDSTLEALSDEFSSILRDAKVIERKSGFFNARESLASESEGKIEGIEMRLASLVFKKNGCSYLISYIARKSHFESERTTYENFLQGFKAP